ncbi:MAG: signal peptidase II [Candidatus Chisholmbacteria bacterium]|nr:signal peptidase II [Candidatus Chisholmbacteria bacterium]
MGKIKKGRVSFWWGGGVVMIDQGMKWWWLTQRWPVVINQGGAWGLFPGWGWGVLMGVILLYLWLTQRQTLALWLVVGGGLSNFLDRWLRGGVVDIFDWGWRFNLADGAIMIGLGWLIWNRR